MCCEFVGAIGCLRTRTIGAAVAILPMLFALGGGFLASNAEWVPFQTYLDSLPAPGLEIPADSTKESAPKRRSKVDKSILAEHPWLLDYIGSDSRASGATTASSSGSARAPNTTKENDLDQDSCVAHCFPGIVWGSRFRDQPWLLCHCSAYCKQPAQPRNLTRSNRSERWARCRSGERARLHFWFTDRAWVSCRFLASCLVGAGASIGDGTVVLETVLGKHCYHTQDDALDGGDIWEEVYRRRQEATGAQSKTRGFVWSVLGGTWTARHRGVAYDDYKGESCSKDSANWAQRHLLASSASFAVKMYGDSGARLLAEAWAERMNAFYAISLGDKKIGHDFTAEEVSRVTNSSAFEDARAQASGSTLR